MLYKVSHENDKLWCLAIYTICSAGSSDSWNGKTAAELHKTAHTVARVQLTLCFGNGVHLELEVIGSGSLLWMCTISCIQFHHPQCRHCNKQFILHTKTCYWTCQYLISFIFCTFYVFMWNYFCIFLPAVSVVHVNYVIKMRWSDVHLHCHLTKNTEFSEHLFVCT